MTRLNKTMAALVCGLLMATVAKAQSTEEFDLTTGVTGPFTAHVPIATMGNDDTWQVEIPGFTIVTPRVCATYASWSDDAACGSRWLSTAMNSAGEPTALPEGNYRYFTTFNISKCPQAVVLNINTMGGDNEIIGLRINSNVYTLDPPQTNDFAPLIGVSSVVINPAHLVNGTNTLSIIVRNYNSSSGFETRGGFNFCGKLKINYWPDVVPSISGGSTFCGNDAMFVFTGSDGPGNATQYQWQVLNIFGGAVLYSSPITSGSPGNFTFSNSLFGCNRGYRIRLRVNTCSGWLETEKVIQYVCPTAAAGADQSICQGACVTIGSSSSDLSTTYTWYALGAVVGTGSQISVCPTVTTTYQVEANREGCLAADDVKITVSPNNPDFTLTHSTASGYFTTTATPVAAVPSGGGFGWFLEELDASGNTAFTISNPGSWWSSPTNTFAGFDRTVTSYPPGSTINTLSSSPSTGKFLYNKTYRLSRGTWTSTCPWNGTTKLFGIFTREAGGEPQLWVKDVEAVDFRNFAQTSTASITEAASDDALRIFPNPSTGIFTVSLNHTAAGVVEVFDVLGKKVETFNLVAGTDTYQIDLSGYAKGIYVVNVTAGDVKQSRKILLQ